MFLFYFVIIFYHLYKSFNDSEIIMYMFRISQPYYLSNDVEKAFEKSLKFSSAFGEIEKLIS